MPLNKETLILHLKILERKLNGFFFISAGMLLLTSLISYDWNDPSFNTITALNSQIPVSNLLGEYGAKISDLLIQFFGISSFIFPISFIIWGWKVIKTNFLRKPILKIFALTALIMSSTIFVSIIPGLNPWGYESWGGFMGLYLIDSIALPIIFKIGVSLGIIILTLSVVFEIKKENWQNGILYLYAVIYYAIIKILKSLSFILKLITPSKLRGLFSKIKIPFASKLKISGDLKDKINSAKPKKVKKTKLKSKEKLIAQKAVSKKIHEGTPYTFPTTDLLSDKCYQPSKNKITQDDLKKQSKELLNVLNDFGIRGEMLGAKAGPIITLQEFEPAAGTKASRIIGLADDIARSMSAVSTRISVIPGHNAMGIELPNEKRETIYLRELLESKDYQETNFKLPLVLGKDIGGDPVMVDLAKMPHLLIAGTTGSGKSVGVNTMIMSLLYKMSPEECKFIMVDPKMLELSVYNGIPHLLTPVLTDPGKAVVALKWVTKEMEDRYRAMASMGVRNISGYNEKIKKAMASGKKLTRTVQTGFDPQTGEPEFETVEMDNKPLPYIVVIVDEMADLMLVAGKDIESSVQRLAQMARAAGIHIIMATQRPSVDVITGVIKANFPTRISFQVTSKVDSRTILGTQGAEQLLGLGDMLYMAGGTRIKRVHGAFVSDSEVENIVSFIKDHWKGEVNYSDEVTEIYSADNSTGNGGDIFSMTSKSDGFGSTGASKDVKDAQLYNQAIEIVKRDRKVSVSYIQRQLRIGYNRAAVLVEKMEEDGIVSPPNRAGKREILVD